MLTVAASPLLSLSLSLLVLSQRLSLSLLAPLLSASQSQSPLRLFRLLSVSLLSVAFAFSESCMSAYVLPLSAHILSPISVSIAVTYTLTQRTDTSLLNITLNSVACALPNVVCTYLPEVCTHPFRTDTAR